ncbi:MAG: BolA family transcriptional regulator [Proteobacteria bacterium]|nr:BolA family transcriptional regulator [Pseudomonadota bacterium]
MSATVMRQMESALRTALAPTQLDIIDDSARHAGHAGARGGGHYRVRLVAAAFSGHNQLQRHRLVYAALAPLLAGAVHAVNIDARAPGEATDAPPT